ncbi:MAG: fused MFS/spermidine synthase, partial [Planctomycetia bacterium]
MPIDRLLVTLAFLLSGASGLVYQTVWVRMATRYLGSTSHATATVLGGFMMGLLIGSLIGGRLADRVKRPLWWYVVLEVGVAVTALAASFLLIETLGALYVQLYDRLPGEAAIQTVQILFVLASLAPSTILMGATLPLLAAWESREQGETLQLALGRLYAVNTYGAVAGVLLAGFVLLGAVGETWTLYAAALGNIVAGGLAAVLLSRRRPGTTDAATAEPIE